MKQNPEPARIEMVYGLACARPEFHAVIKGPPAPRNALEAAWWLALDIWYELVLPSLLFALSITAFAWGFRLI